VGVIGLVSANEMGTELTTELVSLIGVGTLSTMMCQAQLGPKARAWAGL
jgi:hypothetical protein